MKIKVKKLKRPRVVIGNPAVNNKTSFKSLFGKKPKGAYKFINVQASLGWRSLIIHWAVKGIGFGEVTYYIDDKGQLNVDTEGVSPEFCQQLVAEFLKRVKQGKIKLDITSLPKFMETLLTKAKVR